MKNIAQNLFGRFSSLNNQKSNLNHNSEDAMLMHLIREAHSEWSIAQQYFQNVTDPDLVDYAIYQIEATKLRYLYLLKQAREKGLKWEDAFNTSLS